MRVPFLHRLLGLAQLYARQDATDDGLRDLSTTVSKDGSRLRTQEQAMSKATPLLAGLAASLATLTASQKQEADDVAKISNGIAQLVAGKSAGEDGSVALTPDELTQLQGFADGLQTVADNSKANVDALDKVVAEIPTDAEPTEPTGDPEPTAPSEPVGDPAAVEPAKPAEPVGDPSVASTIPDGFSQNG